MNYTLVDFSTWPRGDLFRFYMDHMRVVMSLTVDVNVTPLVRFVKKNGMKFYPAMIWVVSRVINSHEEFKYGWDAEGNLIRWDFISPSYAHFHPDRETFAKLVTPFSSDLETFHRRFLEDRTRYAALDHFDLTDVPPNTFDVSCLPWVRYRSFDMHIFDSGTYLAPVVTWGKYEREGDRTILPVSLNIHHAVADGFHLSRFFLELQELLDAPEIS